MIPKYWVKLHWNAKGREELIDKSTEESYT